MGSIPLKLHKSESIKVIENSENKNILFED